MSRLNVLVLHRMGDPRYRRETVRALEYMIPECRADLNCIAHDADLPFPDYLQEVEYHLIVLGPTFLCNRYHSSHFKKTLINYDFIRTSSACKIALPQDDYDCSEILDEWMDNWSIDRIYTVCPENWNILYQKSINNSEIKLGYTGYISEKWISSWKMPRPHAQRKIDVSYRASKLSANFGSLGQLKFEIAERFLKAVRDIKASSHFKFDISVDVKDLIPGNEWHNFMENSKFCLATPSGSSLLDPQNEIRSCVSLYTTKYPKASFSEIEKLCFLGKDRQYLFMAISPRNIEAALAETVQIATPGSYSNLMKPIDHFIPLNEDCSNIADVLKMMTDMKLVSDIKENCKESIMSEPRLRRTVIVDEIVNFAESVVSRRHLVQTNQENIDRLFQKYRTEMEDITKRFWRHRRTVQYMKAVAVKLGLKKLKNHLSPLKGRGSS